MKEKLLQFFTGKMGKAVYISIASAVVCGVVVITSTVIVHNNNKKIDSVLENLAASESVAELSSESVTESVSDTDNTDSGVQAKAPNGEPAGDKALQYLAEYDKLTEEYERKRAELEQQTTPFPPRKIPKLSQKPSEQDYKRRPPEEYEAALKAWEMESQTFQQVQAQYESVCASERSIIDTAKKELEVLNAQYEQDVAALKAKYGIV
ncbi:MAG: hypothetical protein K1V97_04055 [Lachnospiraceae bacterium]